MKLPQHLKIKLASVAIIFSALIAFAQNPIEATVFNDFTSNNNPTLIVTPTNFFVSVPARDLPVCDDLSTFDGFIVPKDGANTSHDLSAKRKRKLAHLNAAGRSSTAIDPRMQMNIATEETGLNRAPITSFDDIDNSSAPPDPSMAVGPNHVVTMQNGVWAVYDKSGNIAAGWPKTLNDPLSGPNHMDNAGDPVVMYDREADRWFISQFQLSGNPVQTDDVFLVGVSTTPDPTGAYNVYEYELTAGNDYPHYGIWGDSYVTAGNFTGNQKVYTFNRNKMLSGDPTAEIVGFSPANLATGGFAAPIPVHSEGSGTATGDIKIVYYQDDAFSGVSSDHIGLWNIAMNWSNIGSSTISGKIEIPTAPFDAAIAGGFANIAQPGTAQRIDAIVGAVMNMSHWYKFTSHESILLNWVVEIEDGTQKSGIRWVELRSTNGGTTWSVYQEGTFTDPAGATVAEKESVFMGCISMDIQGNIGLGYTKSGTTTFPSLYYTGRMANDPLNVMTVPEELAMTGTVAVTSNDRYGDYGQGVRDPVDDLTFWVTSEYSGDSPTRKSRVYSFRIGVEFENDVAITAISQPTSGASLTNAETVEVVINNLGSNSQSNIPVSLTLDGVVVANEIFVGPLAGESSATYTFTQTVDMSNLGQTYNLVSCTNMVGDEFNGNDCLSVDIEHLVGTELAITEIISPITGADYDNASDVIFTLINNGGAEQNNIPLTVILDGGTPINSTYPGPLAALASINLIIGNIDLSVNGPHEVCVTVAQAGDNDTSNDTLCIDIVVLDCVGTTASGCNLDGIKQFVLGDIDIDNNLQGCNTENPLGIIGYANRSHLTTDLDRANGQNTHTLQASTLYTPESIIAWIDFNDDYIFDPVLEQIVIGAFTTSGNLNDFDFTLPTDTPLGVHFLRVMAYDPSPTGNPVTPGPCDDLVYGETHDYRVNIIDSGAGACSGTATFATSWIPNAPDASTNAIINGTYNTAVDGDIDACSLIVNGTLTIDADTYANIVTNIEVTATGTLIVEHTGSLVQVEDMATVSNAGTINVNYTTATLKPRDFMLMGSPMEADTPLGVDHPIFRKIEFTTSLFSPHPDVQMAFPGGTNFVDAEFDDWSFTTGNFIPGKGYYVMPQETYFDGNTTYNLRYENGTLNNGVVKYAMTFNTPGPDNTANKNASPNLISNPYPSAISAMDFMTANDAVDELYFWEHNSTPSASFPGANTANFNMADISIYNATGFNPSSTGSPEAATAGDIMISSGQGFGIKNNGTPAAQDASFNNAMRRTTGNTTLRAPENNDRLWIAIDNIEYNLGSTTLIGFMDNATQEFDKLYDSKFVGSPVSIYSHIEGSTDALGIQGRESFDEAMQIQLGFISQIDALATYKISVSALTGSNLEGRTVYLIDNATGISTKLNESAYEFMSKDGIYNNRFTVQFIEEGALNTASMALENITLFPNPADDFITISSPNAEILKVELFDLQGKKVLVKELSNYTTQLNVSKLPATFYFVNIETSQGTIARKIIKQ